MVSDADVKERIERLELPFGSAGIDPYGVSKRHLAQAAQLFWKIYHGYFRTECHGIEHVPKRGRAMLVANHSGGYAIDACMLVSACFFELEPPRLAQGMADAFISELPFLSEWATRVGQVTGLPQHARRLLEDDRLLMVFPEGTRGTAKLYSERHDLVRFGTGFVRLALETKTPIIPTCVLGGGEAVPTVANLYRLGKWFGLPYLPVTPYLFALPLPVKIEIRFGAPIWLEGNGHEDDKQIHGMVELVKARIRELIDEGKQTYRRL
ncbi:MAG TPA: lysophospholipid acyltransferase family protein [Polyangiaceae bacterium]|nr:lysophospholipid acyltransferase family protein [Polyangiaceae bacterium]